MNIYFIIRWVGSERFIGAIIDENGNPIEDFKSSYTFEETREKVLDVAKRYQLIGPIFVPDPKNDVDFQETIKTCTSENRKLYISLGLLPNDPGPETMVSDEIWRKTLLSID